MADYLIAEVLSIAAAVFFAVAVVVVKKGLSGSNSISAYTVEVIASSIFFGALLPFVGIPKELPLTGIFWIAVGGLTGTLVARIMQIDAIGRMGASVAAPLSNISAIFSSAFAVFFLSESMTLAIAAGTLLSVVGVFTLSYKGGGPKWPKSYALIPIGSSLFFGIGTVARKYGLVYIRSSNFDTIVNTLAAHAGMLLYMAASRYYRKVKLNRTNVAYFASAGIAYSVALLSLYAALKTGLVILVGPLAATVPLFVLVLAAVFLREKESFSGRVILGCVVVVAGIVLLSV